MSRRKLTPVAQRSLTAISKRGEMIKFGQQPEPPTPSAPVLSSVTISPSGTVTIGTSIRCSWIISSGYPFPTASYDWKVNAISAGAPDNRDFDTTGLNDGDVVTCAVTVTNSEGSDGPQDSSNSATMAQVSYNAPINTVQPVVSGDTAIGSVLSTTDGTWTIDDPGGATYSYEWLRGGTPIAGATNSTYTTTNDDAEQIITSRVTATNNTDAQNASAVSSNSITVDAIPPAGDRATTLLQSETDGLAIAFVDDSMLVKTDGVGTSTDILRGGVVTKSTTPEKVIRGQNGLLGYQHSNHLSKTNEMSHAYWTTSNAASVTGPTNYDEWTITERSDAGATHVYRSGMPIEDGTLAMRGVEMKPTRRYIGFSRRYAPSGTIANNWNKLDTQTGQWLSTGGGYWPPAEDLGDGWWRVTLGPYQVFGAEDSSVNFWQTDDGTTSSPSNDNGDGRTYTVRRPFLYLLEHNGIPTFEGNYVHANDDFYADITWGLPIDHDINGNSLGVLNEPQATNGLVRSNDYTQVWTNTFDDNSPVQGPDGLPGSASALTATTTTDQIWRFYQPLTQGSGDIVVSVIAKAHPGSTWNWLAIRGGLNNPYAHFDLVNGVTGQITGGGGGESSTIEDFGGGWYRCNLIATGANLTTNIFIYSCAADGEGEVSKPGVVGSGFQLWNVDGVDGLAFPTSPIITAGNQVTRETDWYDLPTSAAAWPPSWNNQQGHFYAAVDHPLDQFAVAENKGVIRTQNAELQMNNANNLQGWDGSATATYSANAPKDTLLKVACSFQTGERISSGQGVTGDSDTYAGADYFNGTVSLVIGRHRTTANQNWYGHIREFYYAPSTKTQTELNTLTAP